MINLYLVRPITGSDYILARWCAFLTVMIAASWLPQLILLIAASMRAPTPLVYLQETWLDIPRFLAAGVAMATYVTTQALLVASFTTRRVVASVFLIGLFVITSSLTAALASEIEGLAGQWISMFNLANIPVHVNDVIFGEVNVVMKDFEVPASEMPARTLVSWYFGWTLVPAGILWLRYRRLTP